MHVYSTRYSRLYSTVDSTRNTRGVVRQEFILSIISKDDLLCDEFIREAKGASGWSTLHLCLQYSLGFAHAALTRHFACRVVVLLQSAHLTHRLSSVLHDRALDSFSPASYQHSGLDGFHLVAWHSWASGPVVHSAFHQLEYHPRPSARPWASRSLWDALAPGAVVHRARRLARLCCANVVRVQSKLLTQRDQQK